MDRRTSLISAAAIAAVLLAGGTAVAANIGVLGAAGEDSIGQLSASGEVGSTVSPATSTVSPATSTPTSTATIAPDASADTQGFQVQDAGTVTVRRVGPGIELGDVAPSAGWTWSPASPSPSELSVTFTSSDATYVFTAQVGADGSISARVDQVIVQPSPDVSRPAPATSSASIGDDDGSEYGDDRDEEHEEHEEHEGGEDDD